MKNYIIQKNKREICEILKSHYESFKKTSKYTANDTDGYRIFQRGNNILVLKYINVNVTYTFNKINFTYYFIKDHLRI